MRAAVLTFLLVLVAPAIADAKPRLESARLQFGVVTEVAGAGCAPSTFSVPTSAVEPLRLMPQAGAHVGDYDDIVVTSAQVTGGRVQWTMQPTAEECELYADDPSWSWWTEERSWGLEYREKAYVIRSSAHDGIKSIAGFRVDRPWATIRKARRRFGRPSSLHRNQESCRARWNRLGLTIFFINLGGRGPCKHGFAQYGRVSARAARAPWTAVVGHAPGIAPGTSEAFLDHELIGQQSATDGYWSLADMWIPYGDPGYYSVLDAALGPAGRVRGYEFWIGAGGE